MKSQEIMTKAVIGKGKKKSKKVFKLDTMEIDNILGCWVINHKFEGSIKNNKIVINGVYDINIWYSYDNNSKTNVIVKNIDYFDELNINLENNYNIAKDTNVVIRCLSQPSVIDVVNSDNGIDLTIEKEMSFEIIGDKLVSVNISDQEITYDEIEDYSEINEDYLN